MPARFEEHGPIMWAGDWVWQTRRMDIRLTEPENPPGHGDAIPNWEQLPESELNRTLNRFLREALAAHADPSPEQRDQAFRWAATQTELLLFDPEGLDRELCVGLLRDYVSAFCEGDTWLAGEALASAYLGFADGEAPTVHGSVGVAAVCLDELLTGGHPYAPTDFAKHVTLPEGLWLGAAAAERLLGLAREGLAGHNEGSMCALFGPRGTLAGAALLLAACVQHWAALVGEPEAHLIPLVVK